MQSQRELWCTLGCPAGHSNSRKKTLEKHFLHANSSDHPRIYILGSNHYCDQGCKSRALWCHIHMALFTLFCSFSQNKASVTGAFSFISIPHHQLQLLQLSQLPILGIGMRLAKAKAQRDFLTTFYFLIPPPICWGTGVSLLKVV